MSGKKRAKLKKKPYNRIIFFVENLYIYTRILSPVIFSITHSDMNNHDENDDLKAISHLMEMAEAGTSHLEIIMAAAGREDVESVFSAHSDPVASNEGTVNTEVVEFGISLGLSKEHALLLAPTIGESMGGKTGPAAIKLHAKRWIRDTKNKEDSFQAKTLDVLYSTSYFIISGMGPLPSDVASRLRDAFHKVIEGGDVEEKVAFLYLMYMSLASLHKHDKSVRVDARRDGVPETFGARDMRASSAVDRGSSSSQQASESSRATQDTRNRISEAKQTSVPFSLYIEDRKREAFYDIDPMYINFIKRYEKGTVSSQRLHALLKNEAITWLKRIKALLTRTEIDHAVLELHQKLYPESIEHVMRDPMTLRIVYIAREAKAINQNRT